MIRTRLTILALTLLTACSWYDNQTTFFNTYYNMKRIMTEVKDEFEFQDETKRIKPRLLVPGIDSLMDKKEGASTGQIPTFVKAFAIDKAKVQPVATKVDSILIKGSKILANHPKSEYVEGSLYLMAEAYFIKSEYVPSQQKCIELIDKFADGDLSPDAHLLLSKDYLLQKKMSLATTMLSKTVDIAWYKDRFDILSEAFRIQAELAIDKGDLEGALQPYKQAIAQSEDEGQRASWQVDVGGIYYRVGRYAQAVEAFERVFDYTPEALAQFEATLYRGASLAQLGKYDEAQRVFTEMRAESKYEEWLSFIDAEELALQRLQKAGRTDPALIAAERKADTSYVGRPEIIAQSFQKGMALYKQGQYSEALSYFAKAKVVRTPVFDVASKYFAALKRWEDEHRKIRQVGMMKIERAGIQEFQDSLTGIQCGAYYELGRIHEDLGNRDSAVLYYQKAYDNPRGTANDSSRCLYAQSRVLRATDPVAADSLLDVIVDRFPKSEYGMEAQDRLGFVTDVVPDEAAELYRSGNSFRKVKDYGYAERQFLSLVQSHGKSEYAPKALYTLGYMFERDLQQNDSAIMYYQRLLEEYPTSEYAKEIRPSVEWAIAKRTGAEISDSMLLRDLDQDLYEEAKRGEQNVLDQMIQKNQNALDVRGPGGLTMPSGLIPGVGGTPSTTTPQGGGGPGGGQDLNQQLQDQMRRMLGQDSTGQGQSDTTRRRP
jgi:tetratricopeptide (TPR) repeat protein